MHRGLISIGQVLLPLSKIIHPAGPQASWDVNAIRGPFWWPDRKWYYVKRSS